MARKLGADAVIDERAWQSSRAFASKVPHAKGTAVKLLDAPPSINKVPGERY